MASIQGLSSAVLDTAKKKSSYKTYFHLVTFACVSASIFLDGIWLYVLAVIALLAELLSWLLSISISSTKSLGQELLRLNILKEAFGERMEVETSYLKSKVGKSDYLKSEQFECDGYYGTKEEAPEKRLVHIIQESCFWSQHLYQSCFYRSVKLSIFTGIVIIILIVSGLALIDNDPNFSTPRLALIFLTFLPLWNLIESSIGFSQATKKLSGIDQQLGNSGYNTSHILFIFAEYNVVTSNTPLIPQKVYDEERDKLNELWAERTTN